MKYQIFYPYRDDWGSIIFVRSGRMASTLKHALLRLEKLPKTSFIRTSSGRFVMEKTS